MDLTVVPQFIVGGPECCGRLPELSSSSPHLGVDLGSRGCGRVGSEVAGDSRSFNLGPQLPAPGVFLSPLRSNGSGHRCLSTGLGWTAAIRIPSFCADLSSPKHGGVVHRDLSHPHRSLLASEGVVPCAPESGGGSSGLPTHTSRPTQTAPLPSSAPEPPLAEPSCVETVQRFARHLGLSQRVGRQLPFCRHQSTRRLYQHRWECYRGWYSRREHSVSSPSVPKIADFLMYLRLEKHLSVAAIKGYHSPLVSVSKFRLPELLDSFILRELICSFEIECLCCPVGPPSWDLVLTYLHGSTFEPLPFWLLRWPRGQVSFRLSLVGWPPMALTFRWRTSRNSW